jgi:flagellar FliL protein
MTDVSAAEGTDVQAPQGKLGKLLAPLAPVRAFLGRFNKWVLIGGAAVLVLAIAGIFLRGGSHEKEHAGPPKALFYDLPEMTVNLAASPERPQYLRVRITLEVDDPKVIDAVRPVMPRVIDTFQTHIRELRVTDLEGSAGLFRLREELTRRVNLAIAPAHIRAVLFREIVVQ